VVNDSSEHAFVDAMDVSRETLERLRIYAATLVKWNSSINLVSKSSLNDLWSRHFLDSAQLLAVAGTKYSKWVDIGSGAGFPGLVVAIMAHGSGIDAEFVLIESDGRKAEFLRSVSRETNVPITVLTERIEAATPQSADILSARALAPLTDLLAFAEIHLRPGGRALFPKGATFREEIKIALEKWAFEGEECPSKTDASSVILSLGDIRRV